MARKRKTVDKAKVEAATRMLMEALPLNLASEDLKDTPARVARAWVEFLDYAPGNLETTFTEDIVDEMVAVHGIRVWSYCAHHMLPFYTDISISYITRDRVLGLSKMARVAHKHAHALTTQEKLVAGIANEIARLGNTDDVGVVGQGVHLCMVMRGIKTPGTMTTSHMRGRYRDVPQTRAEFLQLVSKAQSPIAPH